MLLGMMLALLSKRKEITQKKMVSVQAATENYYGFGGCQTVISHTPENEMEKPRSRHTESIYSEEPFLGQYKASPFFCSHTEQKGSSNIPLFYYNGVIHSKKAPPPGIT